ncbi:MAG: hypothetical protein K0S74_710 [Chlamydiales bacterium]|jgi:hypothetical protein|nr:hypothetical protein [Chlamydiales bacterium]
MNEQSKDPSPEKSALEDTLQNLDLGDGLAELEALFGNSSDSANPNGELEDLDIDALLKEAEELDLDSLVVQSSRFQSELGTPTVNAKTSEPSDASTKAADKTQSPPSSNANVEQAFAATEEEDKELEALLMQSKDLTGVLKSPLNILDNSAQEEEQSAEALDKELEEALEQLMNKESLEQPFEEVIEDKVTTSPEPIVIHEGIEFAADEDEAVTKAMSAQTQRLNESSQQNQEADTSVERANSQGSTSAIDYITEDDDSIGDPYSEAELMVDTAELRETRRQQKIRMMLLVTLVVSFFGASLLGAYLHYSQKYGEQKLLISQSLVDIGMGLLSAKLQGQLALPENQPVTVEFIRSELKTLLPYPYQILSPINNATGLDTPGYKCNIHYSSDFSQFIIFAKPEKEIAATILSKPGYIVDSNSMLLYEIHDLGAWKKLFKSKPKLEDVRSDVVKLLANALIVPIEALDPDNRQLGLKTPLEAAEETNNNNTRYYLYNAPKFYQLGAEIIEKAALLGQGEKYQQDIDLLKTKLQTFSSFRHYILYSSQGPTLAVDAYKGLKQYFPGVEFLFGYVELNSTHGRIDTAKLIDITDSATVLSFTHSNNSKSGNPQYNSNNSLLKQLKGIVDNRKIAIERINQQIKILIDQNEVDPVVDFDVQFNTLRQEQQKILDEENSKVAQRIQLMYETYSMSPLHLVELYTAIHELSLDELVLESTKVLLKDNYETAAGSLVIDKDNIADRSFQKIERATDFTELNQAVDQLFQDIDSSSIDPFQKNVINNLLKNKVLDKVSAFILTPQDQSQNKPLVQDQHDLLDEVLQKVGINASEERSFYLSEFDYLIAKINQMPSEESLVKFHTIETELKKNIESDPNLLSSQKEEAYKYYDYSLGEIEQQQAKLKQIQGQIQDFPLNNLNNLTPAEQIENNIRIGQQIIATYGPMNQSEDKDSRLQEAINLLYPALIDNRLLWSSILEARYQMLKSSENKISTLLSQSKLGFSLQEKSLLNEVKSGLINYVNAKYKLLSALSNTEQYRIQFEAFKQDNIKTLELILNYTQTIHTNSNILQKVTLEYLNKMETFLLEYEDSRKQGYFTSNQSYHSLVVSRIKHKLKSAIYLKKNLDEGLNQIRESTDNYKGIVEKEMSSLNKGTIATQSTTNQLQQQVNSVPLPSLDKDQYPKKFQNLFEINISPSQA